MVDASTIAVLIWLKLYSTGSTRLVMFLRLRRTHQSAPKRFVALGPYEPPFKPVVMLGP